MKIQPRHFVFFLICKKNGCDPNMATWEHIRSQIGMFLFTVIEL